MRACLNKKNASGVGAENQTRGEGGANNPAEGWQLPTELCGFDELDERLRVKTRTAHQSAVEFLLFH